MSRTLKGYRVGGLAVASAVDLPALADPVGAQDADVVIDLTAQRPHIRGTTATGANWAVGPGAWLVNLGTTETIQVRDGRHVDLWSATGRPRWSPFLLPGSAFAVIAYMRGRLPLHGSALATPGGAILVLGESGAGKSTLALALAHAGHTPLADDLCLPEIEGGRAVLRPVFPRLRSCADAAEAFGVTGEPMPGGKVRLPLPLGLDATARPILAILALEGRDGQTARLVRRRGAGACATVLRYRWAAHAADWYCGTPACMALALALAERVPVIGVTLPDGIDRLTAFCDGIEDAIGSLSD